MGRIGTGEICRLGLAGPERLPVEISDMKRLPRSLTAGFAAVVLVLVAANTVRASGRQATNATRNATGVDRILLAQNVGGKEQKDAAQAKINLDSQGVILK